jgi:hypothetical protein
MAHVPKASRRRASHIHTSHPTHMDSGFTVATEGHEEPQKQEAEVDASFGTQNIQNESITLSKLRLQDEFGSTILSPSGFVGSWEDFVNTSLYNGSFGDNRSNAGSSALGRTSYVPYWTIEDVTGTNTWTSAPGYVKFNTGTASNKGRMTSDPIRVRMGVRLGFALTGVNPDLAASVATVTMKVEEFDKDMVSTATTTLESRTYTGGGGDSIKHYGSLLPDSSLSSLASTPTVFIKVIIEIVATTLSASNCSFALFEVDVFLADVPHGDSVADFPPNPGANEHFYRDDLGMDFVWDGNSSRWLCTCPHVQPFIMTVTTTLPITATASSRFEVALPSPAWGDDILIQELTAYFHVITGGSALSASHKWVATTATFPNATITGTLNINSGSSGVDRSISDMTTYIVDIGTEHTLNMNWTKTGTPGDLKQSVFIIYRFAFA